MVNLGRLLTTAPLVGSVFRRPHPQPPSSLMISTNYPSSIPTVPITHNNPPTRHHAVDHYYDDDDYFFTDSFLSHDDDDDGKESTMLHEYSFPTAGISIHTLQDLMAYFDLIRMTSKDFRAQSVARRSISRAGYTAHEFIHSAKTKICASLSTRMLSDGKYDVAVVIPGTRKWHHWRMNLNLAMIKFNPATLIEESDAVDEARVEAYYQSLGIPQIPRVSRGFFGAYDSIREELMQATVDLIKQLGPDRIKTISFFGHSLGSAISDLAITDLFETTSALYPGNQIGFRLFKIGAPKTGDQNFVDFMSKRFQWGSLTEMSQSRHFSLDIMNMNDFVPCGGIGMLKLQGPEYVRSPGYRLLLPLNSRKKIRDFTNHLISTYYSSLTDFCSTYFGVQWSDTPSDSFSAYSSTYSDTDSEY